MTGAPITVHTHPGTKRGAEVARVLEEEGADPARVVLGHSGDSEDLDHLQQLADMGYLLGMDRFGIDLRHGRAAGQHRRSSCAGAGTPGSMVLSHDTRCQLDWLDYAAATARAAQLALHPHPRRRAPRRCAKAGSPTSRSTTCWSSNPRRYFEAAERLEPDPADRPHRGG